MIGAGIRRLPQAVADAIAAGEVVERPASVVKELCENAIDAGARRIDVALEGGGLVRISVIDDGAGIDAAELPLAVARHATSKIESARDLEHVATLGFRGEALASIAAVSDMRITSRTASMPAGATMHVRGGTVLDSGAAAASPGTTVEVAELFANTPARLRFLRAVRSESAAAARVVAELALARPDLAFTCSADGRRTLRTSGGSLRDALASVFGVEAARRLVDVDVDGDVAVSGMISEPQAHRATRAGMILVVNGRRVHNRPLLLAIDEAGRGLIPSGRHPYGVIVVTVDPVNVDANVHPAKREVRFRDERGVFAAVQRACWAALRGAPVYSMSSAPPGARYAAAPAEGARPDGATLQLDDAASHSAHDRYANGSRADREPAGANGFWLRDMQPLRALGQAGGEWLVAAGPAGVVVVDPHAAHEKVLYTELLESWESTGAGAAHAQLLLIPAVVECDAAQMERAEVHADFIASCGFALEIFGPALIRCTALPAAAAGGDAGRLVTSLLDALDGHGSDAERRHRVAALVACHAAVRFGDTLAAAEQQRLLDRLLETPGGITCPHGRPAVLVLDDGYLRRAFRRPPV